MQSPIIDKCTWLTKASESLHRCLRDLIHSSLFFKVYIVGFFVLNMR